MKIKVATSQFPVSSDIELNCSYIIGQTIEAQENGCDVVHFPEGSLSGYAGVDFESFDNFNWDLLLKCTSQIIEVAKRTGVWIILGSAHRLSESNKPHNCLYIISNKGRLVDRYDKLFCAGDATNETGDLKHYSSGDHFTIFSINGIKCGVQICHDYRYPELYRELKKQNVEIVFHSYHAGNMDNERKQLMESQIGQEFSEFNVGKTYPEITMPPTMVSYAANNYVWISCSNTSALESCWASFMVRPDGVVIGKLEKNKAGLLISEINTNDSYYDSTKHWRDRALNGVFRSGTNLEDERSKKRNEL